MGKCAILACFNTCRCVWAAPSSGLKSPNLDKLAVEGVRFTNAHATSPVCSPCRNSLLTGVHVPVHGVVENTVSPHKDGLTVFPDVLQGLGYTNFLIGKSHFSPIPSSYVFKDVHTGNTDMRCDTTSYDNGSCPFYNEADFLETYLVNTMIGNVTDFLESSPEGPFFVHLSFVSPHPPDTPPTEPTNFAEMYTSSDLPEVNYQPGDIQLMPYQTQMLLGLLPKDGTPSYINEDDGTLKMDKVDAERVLYYGLCAYVDEQVGRAVDWVDSMGISSSTLIIFTSDHGAFLYDHGGSNEKHSFYDRVWRVPLIFRWPGTLPANATAGFAATIDVTSSILVAAGVDWDAPANNNVESYDQAAWPNQTMFMSGLDVLSPLIDSLKRKQAQTSMTESSTNGTTTNFMGATISVPRTAVPATEFRGYAVVTENWKLVYMSEQGEGRLFDRKNDPEERIDIFQSPSYSAAKNILLVALLRWRAQQDDLQYQLSNWKSAADVGMNARNDSSYMTGRSAEYNLQTSAAEADALWAAISQGQ